MKYVFRIIAVLLFIVFFGFALKNTQEATLRFFWGYEMRGPLVLLLLGFFVGGVVFGILAMLPMVFRNRRELSQCKQRMAAVSREQQEQREASVKPPQPDSVLIR